MRNRGITLLELLLTLCVLVAIGLLAWPTLQRVFETQRLRTAAEQIRARWVGARVSAIESGRPWSFRYEPEGVHFQVASDDEPDAADPPAPGIQSTAEKLLDGIVFATDATSAASPAPVATNSAAPADLAASASESISFYPDGTTSTATVRLRNQRGGWIAISLRGLTGVVSIGDIQSSEEARP